MSALRKIVLLLTAVAVSVPLWAKVELEYFYADDGTLTGRAVNGVRQDFVYDKRVQLLAVKDARGNDIERYVYDPAGNILSKTVGGVTTKYTYDKANQLLTSTRNGKVTRYEYDAAGRLHTANNQCFAPAKFLVIGKTLGVAALAHFIPIGNVAAKEIQDFPSKAAKTTSKGKMAPSRDTCSAVNTNFCQSSYTCTSTNIHSCKNRFDCGTFTCKPASANTSQDPCHPGHTFAE